MKYWTPHPETLHRAITLAEPHSLIVDVGGSNRLFRFPPAHTTIGFSGDINIDLECERLPFGDKEVGFVYCRHTIEDLANPTHLLREIQRVAQNGWIETPSIYAELTRGVDAWGLHRGYCHHRWICAGRENTFTAIAKYPAIETLPLPDYWDMLQENPESWNTVCRFSEEWPLRFSVLQNERGFKLSVVDERLAPAEYLDAINNLI